MGALLGFELDFGAVGGGGGSSRSSLEDVLIEENETMEWKSGQHRWNYKTGTLEIDGSSMDGRHPLYEVITRVSWEAGSRGRQSWLDLSRGADFDSLGFVL